MTTLAVLLIIGSAVVGPIEAQRVDREGIDRTAVREQCYRTHGSSPAIFAPDGQRYDVATYCDTVAGTRLESLPELCERAMKEIGAQTMQAKMHQAIPMPAGTGIMPDGARVRCIPVPAGYKR